MKFLLLTLTLVSWNAFAGFEKILVQNLDLDYEAPLGTGTVEKVGIGVSLNPIPYDIQIERTQTTFELTSPYVDFTWKDPVAFAYQLQRITTKKLSAQLGYSKTHFIEGEALTMKTGKGNEFKTTGVSARCEGESRGNFETRILEDCRHKMDVKINRIDLPFEWKILEDLPSSLVEEEMPADNVVLKVDEGQLYLQLYIKVIFTAGLRTWGYIQYENNNNTIAIRVDEIKFGYVPVTKLVLKKLKETVKDPNIKIDPPWIRINYGVIMHGEKNK